MVSDSEPRYRIVDSNGNVVGSLYGDAASGEVRLEESTNENEIALQTDGTLNAPSISGTEMQYQSVNTEQALNSDIGDSVDYLDPRWFVQSDAIVVNRQPSTPAEWNTTTSGSGSVSFRFWATELNTGTTSSSKAVIHDQLTNRGRIDFMADGFDHPIQARLPTTFDTKTSNGIHEVGIGDINDGDTGKAIYVRYNDSGNLVGVADNGTSETTTTLITSFSDDADRDDILIEYDTDEARFIINGTQEGSISSGLPSNGTKYYITYRVKNGPDTSDNAIKIVELSLVIGP